MATVFGYGLGILNEDDEFAFRTLFPEFLGDLDADSAFRLFVDRASEEERQGYVNDEGTGWVRPVDPYEEHNIARVLMRVVRERFHEANPLLRILLITGEDVAEGYCMIFVSAVSVSEDTEDGFVLKNPSEESLDALTNYTFERQFDVLNQPTWHVLNDAS